MRSDDPRPHVEEVPGAVPPAPRGPALARPAGVEPQDPPAAAIPNEAARARARVGKIINNKWRIDALLGVGGMASVYAATHRNGSRAALKILHAEFARDESIRDRFLREGYVANQSDHIGRVSVLDDDITEQDEPYLVMELLEGETAQQLWKRRGRKVPPVEALGIASQVLDTLESYHRKGIIHRDLKPANVFITKEGLVKLLDFGVARLRDPGGDRTRAGTALGTPSFMAPEQAMGLTESIDARADVFSVGATLYAMLGGERLHQGRSDNEAFILAATTPAPSLARLAPELPTPVIKLVDKALSWDVRNRHESAQAMKTEIDRIIVALGGEPRLASQPPPSSKKDELEAAGFDVSLDELEPEPAAAEPEPDLRENDPVIVRRVELFRRIDRLLPTVRQYGWDHRETGAKLHGVFQALVEALRADGAVAWKLSPYAFVHRGQTIWEPGPPFDAIPYHLYAAGIRGMRALPGITEEELRTVLEVMLLDPATDLAPEDDLAAAIWERRLEHVRADVVHVFAEGDAEEREHFYDEADRMEVLARRATEERINRAEAAALVVDTDREALEAARAAAGVLALDPVARRALGAQLAMSPDRWSERFVDVLADALVNAAMHRDVELVTNALAASVRDLILARRPGLVFSMHEALARTLAERLPPADARALRRHVTRGMFTVETLDLLLRESVRTHLGKSSTGSVSEKLTPLDLAEIERGLEPVLVDLDGEHLDPVLDALGAVWHDGLRRVLVAFIERVLPGNEAKLVDRLMTLDLDLARVLTRMLGQLASPGAREALRRLASCANADLRCEAVVLCAEGPEQAQGELLRLAEHADAGVRFAALRALARHQVRSAGPLLVRRVQDAAFHRLPLDERREVLRALYVLHPARAEAISIEMLQKHGILADDATEQTRAVVAELLGQQARSMEALQAVLGAAKRRLWNSASLRDAATGAAEAIAARLGKRITNSGEVL